MPTRQSVSVAVADRPREIRGAVFAVVVEAMKSERGGLAAFDAEMEAWTVRIGLGRALVEFVLVQRAVIEVVIAVGRERLLRERPRARGRGEREQGPCHQGNSNQRKPLWHDEPPVNPRPGPQLKPSPARGQDGPAVPDRAPWSADRSPLRIFGTERRRPRW